MKQWDKIGDLTLTDEKSPNVARQVNYVQGDQEIGIWQDDSQCLHLDMQVSKEYRNQLITLINHLMVNGLGTLSLGSMLVDAENAPLRLEPVKTNPRISNALIKHAIAQIFNAPHLEGHKEDLMNMIQFAVSTPVPKYIQPTCPSRPEKPAKRPRVDKRNH